MQIAPRPHLKDLAKFAAVTFVIILLATFISAFIATAAEARPLHHHHRGHHAHHAHSHRSVSTRHHSHRFATYGRHGRHARHADRGDSHSGFQSFSFFRSGLVAEARSQIGKGAVYGRSRLWCARFVNVVLRASGHRGTGSDLAASFAHYGHRVQGPQVGAIAVMRRRGGGHVGFVSGVDGNGNPIVISGNHGGRVAESVYPRSRVYAYVMPD